MNASSACFVANISCSAAILPAVHAGPFGAGTTLRGPPSGEITPAGPVPGTRLPPAARLPGIADGNAAVALNDGLVEAMKPKRLGENTAPAGLSWTVIIAPSESPAHVSR